MEQALMLYLVRQAGNLNNSIKVRGNNPPRQGPISSDEHFEGPILGIGP